MTDKLMTMQELCDFMETWRNSRPTILVNSADFYTLADELIKKDWSHLVNLQRSEHVKEGTMIWLDLSASGMLDSFHAAYTEDTSEPAKAGGQPRYVRSAEPS